MLEVIMGVAVFTALCLITKAFRLYAYVGLSVLSMLFPLLTLLLAIAGVVAYFLYRNRSN